VSALLGVFGAAWVARCAVRRDAARARLGVLGLGAAYAVALAGNLDPVDLWAAGYGALLLLVAEAAHAAAGLPDLGAADAATRGRYSQAVAAAVLGGFGVGELLVAVAGSGGSGGAEITALGVAAAAAALAVLALAARRTAAE
jgi:hypothetical protein